MKEFQCLRVLLKREGRMACVINICIGAEAAILWLMYQSDGEEGCLPDKFLQGCSGHAPLGGGSREDSVPTGGTTSLSYPGRALESLLPSTR